MGGLNYTDTFTGMFKQERSIRQSHAGMAHFAGTGPQGKTCKSCAFFNYDRKKPSANQFCRKYFELASGKKAKDKIPHNASACKYYGARK